MSRLPPLVGHEVVRQALGRALARGELASALLLHGPTGIGKQRLGLWLAQRLVCQQPLDAEPCDQCTPCRLALSLQHPDIHWFFPLARPKSSGSADRLAEVLEEARAGELQTRRDEPYRAALPGELAGIYLAQVQTLRRLAMSRPAMGLRKVFLIGDAENLVPQEASTEAANALLKVLEEPPTDTVFIVTASDPDELLPTIRSRLMPVRIQPLPVELVESVLVTATGADPDAARLAARLSEGSIGRALAFIPTDGAPGPLDQVRLDARGLLEASLATEATDRLVAALTTSPAGARGAFVDTLDFLALWIRDLSAVAAGAAEQVVNVDSIDRLRVLAGRLSGLGRGAGDALRSIDLARGMTRSNINPQLILASLLRQINQALTRLV
jgi:DNA polymerase-3 subunit delta'